MTTPTSNYNLSRTTVDIADQALKIARKIPSVKLTLIGQVEDPSTDLLTADGFACHEPYDIASIGAAVALFKNADGTDSEVSLMIEQAAAAGHKNIQVVVCKTSDYADENARWDALKSSFANIKHGQLDWIYSEKAYADATGLSGTDADGDSRDSYYNLFGNFCHRATKIGNTTRAVVGLKPLLEVANDENWVGAPTSEPEELFAVPKLKEIMEWPKHVKGVDNSSAGLKNHSAETELTGYVLGSVEAQEGVIHPGYTGWAKDEDGTTAEDWTGEPVDGLRAVTVFGAPARQILASTRLRAAEKGYSGQLSQNTNGACAFAAALAGLKRGEIITGKTIPSLIAARTTPYSFAEEMLNARVATMYTSGNNNFVVSAGITGAHNASLYTRSDYVKISTYDIMISAVDICKTIADRYLNKFSNPELLAQLDVELNEGLRTLSKAGILKDAEVVIIQDQEQEILGQLDIEIGIRPYYEINEIRFRTTLKKD